MNWRATEEKSAKILMAAATAVILSSLLLILGTVFVKGFSSLNLDMITRTPEGGYYLGKEGGILNAIVGSLYLTGGATVLALFLSLPVAIYLNLYARRGSRLASAARFSLDVLWGVPSIVYGAFGFTLLLAFGLRASLLGGIIAVALLIFPIMCRAMDESIRMMPAGLFTASYALGATRLETALKVVIRQCLPGLLTALLIAFGRGIGDAASVIFTAGFSDSIPVSLFRPAATLPLAVFFQLSTPFPEVQDRAYASALILTAVILLISLLSRLLTRKLRKNIVK
ncbi:MAG: phosphate ABC transporter permease PstA [Candidatus Erginobacter occultus]|nr:phosphate ABC transporter permease PstA [Candidatus Erginobacter occultus]